MTDQPVRVYYGKDGNSDLQLSVYGNTNIEGDNPPDALVILNPAIEADRRAILLYAAIIQSTDPERARQLRELAGNGVKR